MRKFNCMLCVLLSLLLAVTEAGALVFEDPLGRPVGKDKTSLTVGNTTKVSGSFFTTQFGNNTSDIDVRNMVHGYSPTVWTTQLEFLVDPMVVENLTKTADETGTTYTVIIRDNLTYNDGKTPITAKDYLFSYLMLASDEFAGLGADTGAWAHIVGYDDYAAGKTELLTGLHLIDDYTFSMTVKSEYEPYFYEMSYLTVFPYPIDVLAPGCAVADNGSGAFITCKYPEVDDKLFTTELLAETIFGENGYLSYPKLTSGPYSLVDYDPASGTVKFVKNEFYVGNYEGIKPVIDEVTLVPVLPETMVDDMLSGRVDVLNKCVDDSVIREAEEKLSDYTVLDYDRLGYGFIAFANERGPQQFVKVRQAIACCLDAQAFVDDFLSSHGMVVRGYYGVGQWMTKVALGHLRPEITPDQAEALKARADQIIRFNDPNAGMIFTVPGDDEGPDDDMANDQEHLPERQMTADEGEDEKTAENGTTAIGTRTSEGETEDEKEKTATDAGTAPAGTRTSEGESEDEKEKTATDAGTAPAGGRTSEAKDDEEEPEKVASVGTGAPTNLLLASSTTVNLPPPALKNQGNGTDGTALPEDGSYVFYGLETIDGPYNSYIENSTVWDLFNLDELDQYPLDTGRAIRLLEEDGWTLNANGGSYDAESDKVRYKKLDDGSLMALSFSFGQCADNPGAQQIVDMLSESFEVVGAEMNVEVVPFTEILADHYAVGEDRRFDMIFMATNFVSTFDPYMTLVDGDEYYGAMNKTGMTDEDLVAKAWDMHATEPFNLYEYEAKWIIFQKAYNELLPTLPIYSNVYFDYTIPELMNYHTDAERGWPEAVLHSYIAVEEPAAEQ